jgi:hypothetical protein
MGFDDLYLLPSDSSKRKVHLVCSVFNLVSYAWNLLPNSQVSQTWGSLNSMCSTPPGRISRICYVVAATLSGWAWSDAISRMNWHWFGHYLTCSTCGSRSDCTITKIELHAAMLSSFVYDRAVHTYCSTPCIKTRERTSAVLRPVHVFSSLILLYFSMGSRRCDASHCSLKLNKERYVWCRHNFASNFVLVCVALRGLIFFKAEVLNPALN